MSGLEKVLRAALEIFEDPTTDYEREPGFEDPEMDEAVRQLRKSCHAIALARRLLHDDALSPGKHFTAVIELCFNAIERASQAALAGSEALQDHHTRSHHELLIDSHLAGLWGQDEVGSIAQL